MTFLYYQPFLW